MEGLPVRIENLGMERFGRRSNLFLEGFSDHLNVVYGPNGSGKTTTIQFVRWMLFGNCDDTCRRYVSETPAPASGSMTVVHDGLRRNIARQDDGTRYGRVAVDRGDHYSRQTNHMVSLLGEISQTDFDQIFAPSFDREPNLRALLQTIQSRSFHFSPQRFTSQRAQELRLRMDHLRRDLDRLPWMGNDLHHLLERRRTLERTIEELRVEVSRRRENYDREYEELNHQIQGQEAEIARIRDDWHARDTDVAARRRELEEAWQVAEDTKQQYLRHRRAELANVAENLDRARNMSSEIQGRYERVKEELRDQAEHPSHSSRDAEPVCLVKSIASQLDQLRGSQPTHLPTLASPGESLPPTLSTPTASLDLLRSEIGALCRILQEQRTEDRTKALEEELEQLKQCEAVIDRWVDGLAAQRDQLADELFEVERHGVSLVVDELDPATQVGAQPYIGDVSNPRRIRAVAHACDAYLPLEPEADPLLRRLMAQRDAIGSDQEAAERRLRQLLDRRRELEAALGRLQDRELDHAVREMSELDVSIRTAEERDRIQREINQLEAERMRHTDDVRPSPFVEDASHLLSQLSGGKFVRIRLEGIHAVSVEDATGHLVQHEHLSRGARDQLYLSMCLAVIASYRERGVELPLILNDAFINIDSELDNAMASVISNFARKGHQVILFTRHRHVAQLFEHENARYIELGPVARQVAAEPLLTEDVIDQVRFRPRNTVAADDADVSPERSEGQAENGRRVHAARERQVVTGSRSESGRPAALVDRTTSLATTGSLDAETVARLRAIGIISVHDFLHSSLTTIEHELSQWGLSARPLRRWQQELNLRVAVPDLNAEDARLLVASGISDVAALAEADGKTIRERIQQFVSSPRSGRAGTVGYRCDPQRVSQWIRAARASYEDPRVESYGTNDYGRDEDGERRSLTRRSRPANRENSRRSGRSAANSNRRRRSSRNRASNRLGASRSRSTTSDKSRSSQRKRSPRSSSEPASSAGTPQTGPRFYLGKSDAVVDAPSIGSRTAERLTAVGIESVADLLAADHIELAARLDYKRINADTIRQWQAQSRLACCIPQLRGHDAQILVACGIEDSHDLAQMDPGELWSVVGPFVKTAECKRIIRNGKEPDLEEVSDWIEWANDARKLHAA